MSGDYSRFSFDPLRDFSSVLMQQGRVQLDADWNEFAAQLARRLQAGALDSTGLVYVSKETPEAFKIEASGGALTIGRGRLYVDGLLAENHGRIPLEWEPPEDQELIPLEWEPLLAELSGTTDTPYDKQPFYPNALALPDGGPHLVYLDVWRREVTYIEQPELVERAVGVDTTTRLQTVWQVKVFPNVGTGATCETKLEDFPDWLPQNAHSAGRLSTSTGKLADVPDPCDVPPSADYTGLENQLYRLEIHDAGAPGTATFKWSRDNASVATRVAAIPELDQLVVESIGRDELLRFSGGDWIEITDDILELHGMPGELRRIKPGGVNDDTRTIILEKPLTAGLFPTDLQDKTNPHRHTRIRRWDQKAKVRDGAGSVFHDLDAAGSTGEIPVPPSGTSIYLESGILATFDLDPELDPEDRQFRGGDYWVFWARGTDAKIEELEQAPPRGIHHHYTKLALVTFPDAETDCRPRPPQAEAGCCRVVRPGEDIQAALDALPEEGGCVCLKTGTHEIRDALRIIRSNVVIHGESRGAHVIRRNGATLLAIGNPAGLLVEQVTVADIAFECDRAEADDENQFSLLTLDACGQTVIENCAISAPRFQTLVGIQISGCSDVRISHCEVDNLWAGLWVASDSTRLTIVDNAFSARTDEDDDNTDGGGVGVHMMLAYGPSRIERNTIFGFISGVVLNQDLSSETPHSDADGSVISFNRIERADLRAREPDDPEKKVFAIDVAADDCVIANNTLTYAAAAYGGIAVTGSNCRIEHNTLNYVEQSDERSFPFGILLGINSEFTQFTLLGGTIAGNHVYGAQRAISVGHNSGVEVLDNRIESSVGEAPSGIFLFNVDRARVQGNRVANAELGIAAGLGQANAIIGNTIIHGKLGVSAESEESLEVAQNRIEDMRQGGFIGMELSGKLAITENRFIACGYEERIAIGISVFQHLGELHIESCEVMNTGISPDGLTVSPLARAIFADLVLECRVQSNLVTYSDAAVLDPNQEHRALWLRGLLERVITLGNTQQIFGFSAQVLDNKFLGPGLSALVEIAQDVVTDNIFRRFERVFFNNNFCWHWSVPGDERRGTVSLAGRSAIVMGNHFKTNALLASVDFNDVDRAVYMGNVALRDPINFPGVPNGVPASVSDFNINS